MVGESRDTVRSTKPAENAHRVPLSEALAGLPFASEKAATVLGLKVTGQWTRTTRRDLSAQWACTPENVDKVAAAVDAFLLHLAGEEPTRRLVVHQLLLALRELNEITDATKRVALRVRVAGELAKVTGLVKSAVLQMTAEGAPPALTDDALKGS